MFFAKRVIIKTIINEPLDEFRMIGQLFPNQFLLLTQVGNTFAKVLILYHIIENLRVKTKLSEYFNSMFLENLIRVCVFVFLVDV